MLQLFRKEQAIGSDDFVIEFDTPTKMRDGVKLSSDIYRPRRTGRCPTILVRTPYGNHDTAWVNFGRKFASWGYAVVVQDVRGRHDSEGKWYPFTNEGPDGFATLRWINRQLWSNGRVGMTGGSYNAMVQWDVAILRPPNLKAMISIVSPSDLFFNSWYRSGALVWGDALRWIVHVAGHVNQDDLLPYTVPNAYKHLPLTTGDEALGQRISFWRDWLKHQTHDSYWKTRGYHDKYHRINVPVLHISGWYDDCADGNIRNYLGMKSNSAAHRNQRLIMGPWPHRINTNRKYGEVDFGPNSIIDLDDLQKRWFDYWLNSKKNSVMKEKPVTIFVMGLNKWREENEWPLKRTKYTRYYLHSKGHANSSAGDGWLSTRTATSTEIQSDAFDYDPENPCPSTPNLIEPDDRRVAERRDDVLVYDSPLLTRAVEVTGNIFAEIFASTSAYNTDFTAHLVDVHPNGYAHPIADGIMNCRFRDSLTHPSILEPGKVYCYRIDLWYTSNVFKPKHRIRLEISSSDFPRYARNTNTGRPYGEDSTSNLAHQEISHNKSHPSNIKLPIIR